MHLKMLSTKRQPFYSGLVVLTIVGMQPMSMIAAITMRPVDQDDIDDCRFSLPTFWGTAAI